MAERVSIPIEALPTPMALLDGEGCVIVANAALRALLGEDLHGAPLRALLALTASQIDEDDFGEAFAFEIGGERHWRRLGVEAGFATLTDITAAKAALDRIYPAREARDRLLGVAAIGTWRFDPDEDLYYFSPEIRAPYETTEGGRPRSFVEALCHPDDLLIERPIRERIAREGGEGEFELRMRTMQGEWNHLRVLLRAGRQLKSGLYELYGLTQHVTELARARDTARANAQRLDLALKASHAAVFEFDYETEKYWLSPEFEGLVGAETLKRAGRDPMKLFRKEDWPALMEMSQRAESVAGADYADLRLMAEAGERWVRLYYDVERWVDGRQHRGVGLLLDIDGAKRQELAVVEARQVAEAATQAKSDFLASVSHEIRTPMNGIVGVLNLLKRDALSEEGQGLLKEALGCAEMLGQLINDVLDFSKIEAGKLELAPIPTEPAMIVESVVSLLKPQAEAKGLWLRTDIPAGVGWAEIDPVRLRQCLFNTIGNAVKFTERGGVEVRLRAIGEGAARRLRCEIEDTGIGIPEDARERMFGRFQQAESGSTRRFGGTGLGLAISRQLSRMMGGDLDYESREGQGSTFWFEIAAPACAGPLVEDAVADGEAPLSGLKVLVVDDNRVNRLVAVKTLEAMGASAEAVEGGHEAVEAARLGYDLILMDVNMPGMDGLEATRRIRALGAGRGGDTPIIALTADVMRHQQEACIAAGMDGVASKPFSPAKLLTEIARLGAEPEPLQAVG